MPPDFPEVQARSIRLVSAHYRPQINTDNLIREIKAKPYFTTASSPMEIR